MASLKDIRARISSTKNTQKITSAMKLVSAAKLRRAQNNIINLRPYAHKLLQVVADIASTHRVEHPLLSPSIDPKKILLVVLSSDRGLCGPFNGGINKFAHQFYKENKEKYEEIDLLVIGRKSSEFFKNRNITPKDTILNLAKEISYTMASKVADQLMTSYVDGHYDEILLVYNEFKSAIAQEVICETLLPVDMKKNSFEESDDRAGFSHDLIFEPEPEEIITQLLEKHFSVQIYRCMSESIAAEHAARMNAMENATNNAKDLISALTLNYNNLRQASITTELIEITSGAEALNG